MTITINKYITLWITMLAYNKYEVYMIITIDIMIHGSTFLMIF